MLEEIFAEKFADSKNMPTFALAISNGVVVQLVRIPACHAGGRGFESRPYREALEIFKAF